MFQPKDIALSTKAGILTKMVTVPPWTANKKEEQNVGVTMR
jgi:hypothetical protein